MIKWTDPALSQGFQALLTAVSGFPAQEVYLWGANVPFSRTESNTAHYAPLSGTGTLWLTQVQFWPIAHVGDGRWAATSELFTWTPARSFTAHGWLITAPGFGGIIFGEQLWPGGRVLAAGEPFNLQITLVLSDGCPACVC